VALNAEQIFLDALGREPTAEELQDIRLNLWMLTRAGFAVDDPSNAPFIAPWAWMWARLPRPSAPQTGPSAPRPEVALREIPAKLDPGALAAAITERMPSLIVRHRIDGGALTTMLRESFTLVWVWIATFAIGLAGVPGWHYGALHERSTLAQQIARQMPPPHHPSRVNQAPARPRHRP
jgi:hypothetical protein